MQIQMLKTARGADDGVNVRSYEAGETYDVSDILAQAFLGDRVAELAGQPEPKAKPATKTRTGAKNAGAAPENKST